MGKFIFWFSIIILGYTYFGYYLLLNVLARVFGDKDKVTFKEAYYPQTTIIIPAYNEESVIEQRIQNLIELDYPKDKLEIIIASDGSNDRTVEIVEKYEKQGIRALDFKENRGRADVHNDSEKLASGEIVVFTDADTLFEKDFINKIVMPFSDPKVGCTVGQLIYKPKGTSISEAESRYYNKWEFNLKELESILGILANGTGACMAIRKELFRPLTPIDDVDTATVVDMVLKGFRTVFVKDAIAYDLPPSSVKSELSYRIRGTSKTIMSLARRTNFRGWLKNPILGWSILSHRVFRYCMPYFMIVAAISNMFLLEKGILYQVTFAIQSIFYVLLFVGWLGEHIRKRVPIASAIFSFGVAMFGMAIGVAKGITGRAPTAYKMED